MMESDEEMYPDVRPKRQTRQSVRLQEFDADYVLTISTLSTMVGSGLDNPFPAIPDLLW